MSSNIFSNAEVPLLLKVLFKIKNMNLDEFVLKENLHNLIEDTKRAIHQLKINVSGLRIKQIETM